MRLYYFRKRLKVRETDERLVLQAKNYVSIYAKKVRFRGKNKKLFPGKCLVASDFIKNDLLLLKAKKRRLIKRLERDMKQREEKEKQEAAEKRHQQTQMKSKNKLVHELLKTLSEKQKIEKRSNKLMKKNEAKERKLKRQEAKTNRTWVANRVLF